ncbi:MAG TPA: transporter substrate-binding domain-containing protein [Stellaceae bacterium]|nr:transporter substrate-binding domain-containing protein [Stellaceae bacterium]
MRDITRMRRALRCIGYAMACAALVMIAAIASPVSAQTAQRTIRVETFIAPPFVIEQDGGLSGFSIDLWTEVARRLGIKTEYQMAPDVASGFEAMRSKNADIAVSGVFISKERDREFDFSYTILEAGLQVMVRDTGRTGPVHPLTDLLDLMLSKTTLVWLVAGLLLLLIPAHIVWLIERRHREGIILTAKYYPGIFYAIFWSGSTLLTQGENMPRHWLARVVALLWMFAGVVFVAVYTAQLTTNMTVEQIRGIINGPEDLPGKDVGTLAGSTSVKYLREHNARLHEFQHLEEMYQALTDKRVDAVLFDAASLRYYETHEGKGMVRTVGPEFDKGDVGFVFQDGSPLRREVNAALVAMREDGTYQQIKSKWFGSEVETGGQ